MLAAGITPGPHKILTPIGAGGMCPTPDTHLGRGVAINFIPPELSAFAQRLNRVEQAGEA